MWRQLLTEGLLLAAVGGLSGLACAAWASRGLGGFIFEDYVITVGFDPTPDRRVASFAIATTLLFGALFTLLPAWRATRQPPLGLQQANSRTTTARHAGRWLVAAQVALSLVLLIAAGLFVRTLQAIRSTTDGLSSDGVVVAFPLSRPRAYSHLDNDIYYRQTLDRLSAIAGVERASISLYKPAGGGAGDVEQVAPINQPVTTTSGVESIHTPVAPDFFRRARDPAPAGARSLVGRQLSQPQSRGRERHPGAPPVRRQPLGTARPDRALVRSSGRRNRRRRRQRQAL